MVRGRKKASIRCTAAPTAESIQRRRCIEHIWKLCFTWFYCEVQTGSNMFKPSCFLNPAPGDTKSFGKPQYSPHTVHCHQKLGTVLWCSLCFTPSYSVLSAHVRGRRILWKTMPKRSTTSRSGTISFWCSEGRCTELTGSVKQMANENCQIGRFKFV